MSNTEVFFRLYYGFEDRQKWFSDRFTEMTFSEYRGFVAFCLDEIDATAEVDSKKELKRVKGLLLALAWRELQISAFMWGLTAEQRKYFADAASTYYELAKTFYPAHAVPAVEAAWKLNLDYVADFGWPLGESGILPEKKLFRV